MTPPGGDHCLTSRFSPLLLDAVFQSVGGVFVAHGMRMIDVIVANILEHAAIQPESGAKGAAGVHITGIED
ncbi:MAG: hypothetical protein ACQEUG_09060 [Pseudomonadota bacterium]